MDLGKTFREIFVRKTEPFDEIIGQDFAKEQIKSALLMNHHIIIVGPPGIGKTTIAKNVAKLLPEIIVNDCQYHCDPKNPLCPECIVAKGKMKTKKISGKERFIRIQGSPDLTTEDILGDIDPMKALKFGAYSIEAFNPGKIFKANNGVLFFDELNRCPEKLQNSLLQVLEERKATIGSYTFDFPANFIFIGTMNPEDTSTEPLSDVFLDRFDFVYMNYPETLQIENAIVNDKGGKLEVKFDDSLLNMMIYFVRMLRQDKKLEKKPSVRASINLYERAQSNAFLKNRKNVEFEDIKNAVVSVIGHRIRLIPSAKYLQTPFEYVNEEFRKFAQNYEEIKAKKSDAG